MCRPWIICVGFWLLATLSASAQSNVTTYPQMTVQLQAEARQSAWLRMTTLGQSAHGHRELWLARLAAPSSNPAQTRRIVILCRQHGDEPASTEAVLGLIRRVVSHGDPALRAALAQETLYFVPMVNPDGAGANMRANGVGADLNRDWGLFHQPETRAVAQAVKLIQPALVVDAHNWDGNDEYNADCVEVPRESRTAPGKAAHAMQQQLVADLSLSGYAVHPTAWGAEANPHLAHRWFTHQNIPSLLVETHYGPVSDLADFARREGLYTALIQSLARHSAASWVTTSSTETQEATLFPLTPLPTNAHMGLIGSFRHGPKIAPAWLWAFCLYLLALWGLGLRKPDPTTKKAGLGLTSILKRPSPQAVRPSIHYSYAPGSRKRLGTETISRSGQRNAVSLPPR